MEEFHQFANGVKILERHLLPSQLRRYSKINVHEPDEEPLFIKTLADIPTNGCYVNVGGAVGYYAILARRLRPDIQIDVFEPLPVHLEYLKENLSLNGLEEDSVQIHQVAVSDRPGKSEFLVDTYGSHLATSNGLYHANIARPMISVITVPLAKIFELVRRECIDFMQIDIQGWEHRVIHQLFIDLGPHSFRSIKNFLIGTHSEQLHKGCEATLKNNGFAIRESIFGSDLQPDGTLWASDGRGPNAIKS